MNRLLWKSAAALLVIALGIAANFAAEPAKTPSAFDSSNLIRNPDFLTRDPNGTGPADFELTGNVLFQYLGDPKLDASGWGVALESGRDLNPDSKRFGEVAQRVTGIDSKAGRWFRFTFRGLPQEHFAVDEDALSMKVQFFSNGGKTPLDGKAKPLYALIQQDRRDLTVNGDHHVGGSAVWRTYRLDFWLPFEEIDTLRLSVGFDHGSAPSAFQSQFYVTDFELARIDPPASSATNPAESETVAAKPEHLLPIAGRWYFNAKNGETQAPAVFDYTNADRLIYHDDAWNAPFAGSMTAWLKAGDKDLAGNIVQKDRFVPDNVTVRFDATSMIIHTHGLPNHPTGTFPEQAGGLSGGGRGNPNYIQEQDETFYIPLNPQPTAHPVATTTDNSNHALPMGPIGIAANGVVFFNPFDMGNLDASNMMDRCCGHPNQDNLYHYHKYPVCMNSPWADEGKPHSPLIGWAFDGFPIYGPYVKAGLMAKDAAGPDALNAFNIHEDNDRGWHYQVTPGKFPYIIGGYWGTEDPRDKQHPHERGGGNGPGGDGPGSDNGPGGENGPNGNIPPRDRPPRGFRAPPPPF